MLAFFQNVGANKINKGYISSRPNSIVNDRIILLRAEYSTKLPIGPTFPKPGPILPIDAATAVKFDAKSNPSKEIRRRLDVKMSIYTKK